MYTFIDYMTNFFPIACREIEYYTTKTIVIK